MAVEATAISVSVGSTGILSQIPQWGWTLIGGAIFALVVYVLTVAGKKGWIPKI